MIMMKWVPSTKTTSSKERIEGGGRAREREGVLLEEKEEVALYVYD